MNQVDYIFDLGANSGQNLDYYLSRAKKVIAVEANPRLCDQIRNEFKDSIDNKRLVVENVAITGKREFSGARVDFFVHTKSSVHSQMSMPENVNNFEKIKVLSITSSQIIEKYLVPHDATFYVKIDLEGFDSQVLRDLFKHQIYPDYISAESHTIETFSAFLESGVYKSFTLIDGRKVPKYKWRASDNTLHSFRRHSAGPFGHDIAGKWFAPEAFFQLLALEKMGWKDIHASKLSDKCREQLNTRYLVSKICRIVAGGVYQKTFSSRAQEKFSKLNYFFAFSKIKNIYKISWIKHAYKTIFSDL